MTGFGAATLESGGVAVHVEVRSVNHRHLPAKLRLPPELAHLETQAEAVLRKRLSRGSVQASVRVRREGGSAAARIDPELLKSYGKKAARLARELGIAPAGLADLLGLPGVVEPPALPGEDPRVVRLVLRALDRACAEVQRMREQEGAALEADLVKSADAIEKLAARLAKRVPEVVRRHQETLRRRVADLMGTSPPPPPADLARELAVLADRLDVSEELARLESHLVQLRKLLAKGGAIGRTLDFLVQEFFRERRRPV